MCCEGSLPPPLVILLPGLDGTGKFCAEFARILGSSAESVIVAYPKDQPLGYDELEARVLAALPRHRPFLLLAESFAGPIAIRIAAQSPPELLGVILCGSFASNPFPWLGWARPLAAFLPVKSLPRWVRAPLMWGSASPRRAPGQMQRAIAGVSSAVIRRRIAALLSVDENAALGRIRLPTLVIKARRDRVISRAATRRMLAQLPHAQLIEIDGPHLLLQTRPGECAAAVGQFVQAVLRARHRAVPVPAVPP
jgi:pimeloyl-[acyl-carrier protein] methyl ester esterase